ncbi:MAG: nucleotidyltransferase domain-containing protein [Nanoarchaeota archaeon]
MEMLIRRTRELGTSAGVLLPKSWLNKEVSVKVILPLKEEIARDVMNILIDKNLSKDTKGIYLVGSYARGEADFNSDIDILVLTRKMNKIIKHENYEIVLVSEDNFSKNLSESLNFVSFLKEAEPLFNEELIERHKQARHKFNVWRHVKEIEKIIKINTDSVNLCRSTRENVPDGIIYSIVLRLRELYMIKCFISGRNHSKREFVKIVGEKAYNSYNLVKAEQKEANCISPDEAISLLELSEKWLKELRGRKKELRV